MEDVIAVAVTLDDGGVRYFLTWGRIQERVDPDPVARLVLDRSTGFGLGGRPVAARVCWTLQEAALSPNAPYFFECLLPFQVELARRTGDYEQWRAARDEAMRQGREISYCGKPLDLVNREAVALDPPANS